MLGRVGLYRCHVVAIWGAFWAILERYGRGSVGNATRIGGIRPSSVGFTTRIEGARPYSVCFTTRIGGSCGPEKLKEDGGRVHLRLFFGARGVGGEQSIG
jgi:hypothetical protein